MSKDEALSLEQTLRLALEVLESCWEIGMPNAWQKKEDAITVIKAALEAKDEPMAWSEEIIDDLHALYDSEMIKENDSGDALIRLDEAVCVVEEVAQRNTTPPQRKPLSKAEAAITAYRGYDEYWTKDCNGSETEAWIACARAIEAAHGIKGKA